MKLRNHLRINLTIDEDDCEGISYFPQHRKDLKNVDEASWFHLALGSIPRNSRSLIMEAFWKVMEMTARQGVLPRIVEMDRLGNPVE